MAGRGFVCKSAAAAAGPDFVEEEDVGEIVTSVGIGALGGSKK